MAIEDQWFGGAANLVNLAFSYVIVAYLFLEKHCKHFIVPLPISPLFINA